MDNLTGTQRRTEAFMVRLAERQNGLLHRQQALAAGFTPRMIERRLEAGLWIAVHRGVYRLAGVAPSWHQRVLAACFAAGPDAVASHRSAGALWSFDGIEPGPVELTLPRTGGRTIPGTAVHRSRSLLRGACTSVEGVPVTRAPRTLIDLASRLDEPALEAALDSALRQGLVSVPYMQRCLASTGSRGRGGAGGLRSLLADRASTRPAESGRELRLARLLVAVGLPQPVRQYEVSEHGRVLARFDLAYPDCRIAAEFDSYRHHFGRQAWYRDQGRNNRVAALDWLVFPMTESDLRDPTRAAALEVAEAHRRRSGRYGGGVCS